jgi:hypothetical protein
MSIREVPTLTILSIAALSGFLVGALFVVLVAIGALCGGDPNFHWGRSYVYGLEAVLWIAVVAPIVGALLSTIGGVLLLPFARGHDRRFAVVCRRWLTEPRRPSYGRGTKTSLPRGRRR